MPTGGELVVLMAKISTVIARVSTGTAIVLALAVAVSCWMASVVVAAGDANVSVPCANEGLSGFEAYLPDCRALEMVTPTYKDGYAVATTAISADGSRILGRSLGVFAGAVGAPETRNDLGLYYELARGSNGWRANPSTPANPQFRDATTFYTASGDLSRTLFSMPTAPVGEDDFYVRGPGASLVDVGPITPLADGPTVEPAPEGAIPISDFKMEGASSDLSHIVFGLDGRVGWNGDLTHESDTNLYEYVGAGNSEPAMVAVSGGRGSTELIGQCGASVGGPLSTSRFNAVSEDGETVFFTPLAEDDEACGRAEPAVAELYARVHQSETLSISAAECQVGCASGPLSDSVFAGASLDGSRVWFFNTQKLTEQASEDSTSGDTAYRGAGSGCQRAQGTGCNLYEYDFSKPLGERLMAVSSGSSTPHVQGVVRISEDGTHVYFVAQGKLTNQTNVRGEEAQVGMNNLYVSERDASTAEGRVRFISVLAPSGDEELWGGIREADERPAQTTPDGEQLVFESHADLTSDDTSEGVWQVFEYDAATGTLQRVSVGDGGFNNNGNTNAYDATIPSPSLRGRPGVPLPTPLALSDDGKYVFFQSADKLTAGMGDPESGTGTSSVYEYHEGRVYLIYGGTDSSVIFLGTSASGGDAFFETVDELAFEDTDTQVDIYDARVDGGRAAQSAHSGCRGEGCLGGLSGAPVFGLSGSALQSGGGNLLPTKALGQPHHGTAQARARALRHALKVCRAERSHVRRARCETSARKRYTVKSKISVGSRSRHGGK